MPTGDDQLAKTVSLHDYRLDKHGETIDKLEVRLKIVEDNRADFMVLQERVSTLAADLVAGFAAQGDEIKSLRRAVVGAAISIAGSALFLALTLVMH